MDVSEQVLWTGAPSVSLDGFIPDAFSSLLQSLSLPSTTWAMWLEHFLVTTEEKKVVQYSLDFPVYIPGNRVILLFQRGPTFSLTFLLPAFCVCLGIPGQINSLAFREDSVLL